MAKHLRSSYYEQKVANLSTDSSRKWWSNINDLIGKKQTNNAMTNLANKLQDGDLSLIG